MNKFCKALAVFAACLMLLTGCTSAPSASTASTTDSSASESSQESSASSEASSETADNSQSSGTETSSGTDSQTGAAVSASFFDDAVFIGDSVSLRLYYYCQSHQGVLGKAQFLTSGSLGSGNALSDISDESVHPSYQGEKMLIEDGVKATGAKKVFIMLGMNDIGLYGIDDSVKNMETLSERILKKSPDAEIYLQSMTPMLESRQKKSLNNANIEIYNEDLKKLCQEKGYHFVDVASVMKLDDGSLIPEYCSDPEDMGIHFTDAGAEAWISYLLENAGNC